MKAILCSILSVVCVLAFGAPARAQLASGSIVYGHHHLHVTSIAAQKKFWIDTLGGTEASVKGAPFEIVKFPGVFVFMNEMAPTGGTKGTTVNHIGFNVPNLRAAVDKVKAAGYPVVTRAELPPQYEVKDDLGYVTELDGYVAFVMAPDDIKVELVENKTMTGSIALHHIHFAAQDIPAAKAWYVKTFNAIPGKRGPFEAADLPGVNLSWSGSPTPLAGTKDRALDHIGFEVKDLDAFCKQLEASGTKLDRPVAKNAALGISTAFITDPWGTSIELTEGLDKLK